MVIEKILYVALLANLIGTFYYCRDILKGHTKPNLVTWLLWALIPFLGVFFQIKAGAGLSVLPILMDGLNCIIIILFSLWNKNNYWKIRELDIVCGIFASLALIFYVFTHNSAISILFAILADLLAAIPTIIKSWRFPETETWIVYLMAALANIFGLLIIKNWSFSIYSLGIYFVLMNLVIIFAIFHKRIFKKVISF